MLILAHKQKTLGFTFDEAQGVIIFEDQTQQINPTEEFHELFVDVTMLHETYKPLDEQHIRNKVDEFLKNAEKHIWTIRQYKIDEFKKKLKTLFMQKRQMDLEKNRQER